MWMLMSGRAWTILGVGISVAALGVTLFFALTSKKAPGEVVIVAGGLITAYGLVHDKLYSNKLAVAFWDEPPYTFRDAKYGYRVEFRLGVRGSRRIPQDIKVLVSNIQPRPSSHPYFRADYPYSLPLLGSNGDRELLFQLGAAWNTAEGTPIFSGIQMDEKGAPDTLVMGQREIWDVALKVVAADAKSLDVWLSVAPDANGRVRVSRHNWKPISL
jgi:hypothetical protein